MTKTEDIKSFDRAISHAREVISPKVLDDYHFDLLIKACIDAEQLTYIINIFYDHDKRRALGGHRIVRELINLADESDYPLHQWISSLERIYRWMDARDNTADLKKVIGYFSCIAEAPQEKHLSQNLVDLLNYMLEEYGFEGEYKK